MFLKLTWKCEKKKSWASFKDALIAINIKELKMPLALTNLSKYFFSCFDILGISIA
jgi:hypothetical protein